MELKPKLYLFESSNKLYVAKPTYYIILEWRIGLDYTNAIPAGNSAKAIDKIAANS